MSDIIYLQLNKKIKVIALVYDEVKLMLQVLSWYLTGIYTRIKVI